MHPEQQQFCLRTRLRYARFFRDQRVLDVGSLDINGNNRYLFRDCDYTGIDLGAGPNVDIVGHLVDLNGQLKQYDVVISTEALEHDSRWRSTLVCMVEKIVTGGLLLLTWAGPERAEHGTDQSEIGSSPFTGDYYSGLSVETVRAILPMSAFKANEFAENKLIGDAYFWGIKQ